MVRQVLGSITHGGLIELFLIPGSARRLDNMCCHTGRMVHIKESLLLIGKSSPCSGDNGFPFSLWSLTIRSTPYNRKQSGLSDLLNKPYASYAIN